MAGMDNALDELGVLLSYTAQHEESSLHLVIVQQSKEFICIPLDPILLKMPLRNIDAESAGLIPILNVYGQSIFQTSTSSFFLFIDSRENAKL
jgi:hypothetical protein